MAFTVTPEVIADFRAFYDEFADEVIWTDAKITRALYIADQETGGCNWPAYGLRLPDFGVRRRGTYAYAAHWLFMNRRNVQMAQGGAVPMTPQAVTSKSVGDESTSFAAPSQGDGDAWTAWLNLTPYGAEFAMMRRRLWAARIV